MPTNRSTIFLAETCLTNAVCEIVREASKIGASNVSWEVDFGAPSNIGDFGITVMSAGFRPSQYHKTNAGAYDLVYGVDVLVFVRETRKPRDRNTKLAHDLMKSLGDMSEVITGVIDGQLATINMANRMLSDNGSSEGFLTTLMIESCDRKPREVGGDFFASAVDEHRAALARTISFHGARRKCTRVQADIPLEDMP